jgi:hypothetical protein
LPVEPVTFLEASKNLLDRLLAGADRDDLLGGPIEAMDHEFLQSAVIHLKHQASSAGLVHNLIVDQLREEGGW